MVNRLFKLRSGVQLFLMETNFEPRDQSVEKS